jgi:hypothetical protein
MSEANVRIGLPSITWVSGGAVDLLSAPKIRRLPAPVTLPPNRASQQQLLNWFQGYLDGLAALRHEELPGDWTRAGRAKDEASDAAWRRRTRMGMGE